MIDRTTTRLKQLVIFAGLLPMVVVPFLFDGTASGGEAGDREVEQEAEGAPSVEVGGQETSRPPEFAEGRVTDGPDREQADAEIGRVLAQLKDRAPALYDTGDSLEVRLVGPTDAEREFVASASTTKIPFAVRAVDLSLEALQNLAVKLDSSLSPGSAIVGTDLDAHVLTVSIGPDLADDRVREVEDESLALTESAVEEARRTGNASDSADPRALVRFERGSFELTEERNNLPLKGGKWVDTVTLYCTSGWLVQNPAGDVHRFTTAGHCWNGTTNTGITIDNFTGTRTQHWPQGWDTANFSIPSGTNLAEASTTVRSDGSYRRVVDPANPANGTQYCFTGRGIVAQGDDEKCAGQSRSEVIGGKTLYCIERRTYGGDSGGPVYYIQSDGDGAARGTVVGDFTIHQSPPSISRHFTCYNRILDIANAGGWSVTTWK